MIGRFEFTSRWSGRAVCLDDWPIPGGLLIRPLSAWASCLRPHIASPPRVWNLKNTVRYIG